MLLVKSFESFRPLTLPPLRKSKDLTGQTSTDKVVVPRRDISFDYNPMIKESMNDNSYYYDKEAAS